jgi:hypothetical protein
VFLKLISSGILLVTLWAHLKKKKYKEKREDEIHDPQKIIRISSSLNFFFRLYLFFYNKLKNN